MPDPLALKTTDGASLVSIADPLGDAIIAPLLEISPAQAVIDTKSEFEPNAYLDLTLQLKGQPPRKFFAHVVGREEAGLRIRWMHLDPGEEQKLKGLLAAYARTSAPAAIGAGHGKGTRRIIKAGGKPKSETFTPFDEAKPHKTQTFTPFSDSTAVEVELPASPPPRPSPPPEKAGTRRIIKPGAKTQTPPPPPPTYDELHPSPAHAAGPDPVVVAPTDKYEKLPTAEPSPTGTPVVAPEPPPAVHPPQMGGVPVHPPIIGAVPADSPEGQAARAGERSSGSSDSGRAKTIGADGRMDVGAAIRSKAKTVRASELAARHDKVRVLNMGTIKILIQDAVSEAAQHLTQALGEAEKKRLLEEAEDGFKERLKAFELDKKDAEEKARLLQRDLNAAKELLEQERKRSIEADQFTVSEAGLADLDIRMMKIIERSVSRGEAGPELELKLREMIAAILDSEREKMREKELAAHNDKISLLEKKVARLANSLDETEKERDEARQIAEAMEREGLTVTEVRNKYRIGLAGDDPNRERKLALMKELMEQNRELRRQLGLKIRSAEEVAAEQAEEDRRKKERAEQLKRELAEDRAAARSGAAPAPAAAAEPPAEAEETVEAEEPAAEDDGEAADGEPTIDPDDQPWEGPASPAKPAVSEDDRGIKIMRDFKKFEPPPLQVAGAPAAVEEDDQPLANPDDEVWEGPAKSPGT